MAIGAAKMLGYRFPVNFRHPYLASSLSEFWRRWHMTLSRWLRDYLYFSLGGSRQGWMKTYRNLILTMLVGALARSRLDVCCLGASAWCWLIG